jgi:hypothetical protein
MTKLRSAAGDDLLKLLDDGINNFINRTKNDLINVYQQRAGKTVDTEEMKSLPEEFGDFVYHNLFEGPEAAESVKRFLGFHLNEMKLSRLMDKFVEMKRPIPGIRSPLAGTNVSNRVAIRWLEYSKEK